MLANLNLFISVIVGFEFSFFSPMFLDLIYFLLEVASIVILSVSFCSSVIC